MATLFLNSSALVKRYLTEVGSAWVNSLLHPSAGAAAFISRIAAVEVTAAIVRRMRGGSIAPPAVQAARSASSGVSGTLLSFLEVSAQIVD